MKRSLLRLASTGLLFSIAACAAARVDEETPIGTTAEALSACSVPVDASRSLFLTDKDALGHFTLKNVLDQVVATGSTTGQTSTALYRRMLDTLNTKADGTTSGSHCDDVVSGTTPVINGFPIECPRQEGTLSTTNPFAAGPDSYFPVGVVNRFDSAPADGANCGQYRVVFAKTSGKTDIGNRLFIIFEAVLPNPNPASGLAACLPVAQLWDKLSSNPDAVDRGNKVASFFFTGLSGFEPVIKASHYGFGGTTNTGQIRTNMFMRNVSGQQWQLREFRLSQTCNGASCTLAVKNTPVQTNPFGPLFAGNDAAFQANFLKQVAGLAARSIPSIRMTSRDIDNAGESNEQDSSSDYGAQGAANTAFLGKITNKLAALGRTDLSATDILNRATTQSCAGCHQVATFRELGGGLQWPGSNGFTQVDESSLLSRALTDKFLPARAKVLTRFLDTTLGCTSGTDSATPDGDGPVTIGGSAVGAAN